MSQGPTGGAHASHRGHHCLHASRHRLTRQRLQTITLPRADFREDSGSARKCPPRLPSFGPAEAVPVTPSVWQRRNYPSLRRAQPRRQPAPRRLVAMAADVQRSAAAAEALAQDAIVWATQHGLVRTVRRLWLRRNRSSDLGAAEPNICPGIQAKHQDAAPLTRPSRCGSCAEQVVGAHSSFVAWRSTRWHCQDDSQADASEAHSSPDPNLLLAAR